MEFFKFFDQNSNQKTELLPIGKVDRFQNSSKNHKFRSEFWLEIKLWKILIRILLKDLKDFDQNSGG